MHPDKHPHHTWEPATRQGRLATITFLLAFLLGLLTGCAAGITGGALLATHIRDQPRRAIK